MRQHIAIQGIQGGIVDVGRQHAFTKIVQNYYSRCAAQPAKRLLMQLRPHTRTRTKGQQPNTFATAAKRQYEQPWPPVLARIRIAHHRAGAVIHLALFARPSLDDCSSLSRHRSAKLAYKTLHALVAAREPMRVDQVLEDPRRVTATRQLQLDPLAVRFTAAGGTPANRPRRPGSCEKA